MNKFLLILYVFSISINIRGVFIDNVEVQGSNGKIMTGIHYKICCDTINRGGRYLEAFPYKDDVRPRKSSDSQDQMWSFESSGSHYKIKCHTSNRGVRYLEAFPNKDIVRPRLSSDSQDQRWSLIPQNYEILADSRKLLIQARDTISAKPFSMAGLKYLLEYNNIPTMEYITLNNTLLVKPFQLEIRSAAPTMRVYKSDGSYEDCKPGHMVRISTNIINMTNISFGHMKNTSFFGSIIGKGGTHESSRTLHERYNSSRVFRG